MDEEDADLGDLREFHKKVAEGYRTALSAIVAAGTRDRQGYDLLLKGLDERERSGVMSAMAAFAATLVRMVAESRQVPPEHIVAELRQRADEIGLADSD